MLTFNEITAVDLEVSTLCNASCPDCPRNLRGYELTDKRFPLHALTLKEVQALLPVEFIQQLKDFQIIGNHGDFVTCKDGLQIVQYLYNSNPKMSIYISTNGSGQPHIWETLGKIPTLKVGFRIDGLIDTHEIYRRYTNYDLIIKNAKKFIAAGGYAIWEMIKFDHNCHQIDQARELSHQLNFQQFIIHDLGRNKMPVFDRHGNFVRNIGQSDLDIKDINILIQSRQHIIDNHVEWHRQCKQNTVSREIDCLTKKTKKIYIAVNGQVYPCCWTGFFPDSVIERTGNEQIKELSQNNNAFEVGIKRAVEWFTKLEQAWNIPRVVDGRPFICNNTCGKSNCQ